MAERSVSGVESGITCPLCLELYQDPKILPCGHIYCRDPCLTGLARQSNNTTITCPQCRKIVQIPQRDVDAFPTVYNIISLVDSFRAKRKAATDQSDTSSNYCQVHKGQELVVFCDSCSKTLCRDCVIDTTEHVQHSYGYIKKYRKQFLEVLEQNRALVDSLNETITEIEGTRANVLHEKEVVVKNVETEIDRKASEQKVKAHSKVASIANGKLATLQTQHDQLSRVYSEVVKSLQKAERTVENTADSEFPLVKRAVEQLKEVAKKARDVQPFPIIDSRIAVQIHRDEIHFYSGEPADPRRCTYSRESIKNVQLDKLVSISINVFTSEGKFCLGEQSVTVELHYLCEQTTIRLEIQCINPGQYQVDFTPRNRGRHMLAIKVNGRHIFGSPTPMFVHMPPHKLGAPVAVIEDLNRPGGLLNWNGRVLACDMNNDRLIEIEKWCPLVYNFAHVVNGPNELTSDSSSNIYLSTCEDNRLHKLDGQGQILKSIGSTGKGKEQFEYINGVNVSGSFLYICDTGNHRIKVYDLQLDLIEIIGKKGTKLGQFQDPGDLAFDREGNMYVAEQENNRIQVFSPQKKPIREYAVDCPITVHFFNNHLYITQSHQHCVTVMTTTGDHVASFGTGYLQNPEGLVIDEDGFVYATSHYQKIIVF